MSTEVNHAERSHALLSASGSDRWLNCPASPRLEENFPEETSSFAQEGTLAHEFAEIMLKVDLKLITMAVYRKQVAELKKSVFFYDGMQEDVMPYVTYVKEQFSEAKRIDPFAKILIEQKFDLTKYVQDGFGTSDCAIQYSDIVEVIDLKFGKGKLVSAQHNTQLKYYGLGVLETLLSPETVKKVKLTIVQPRMANIESWPIPAKYLTQWGEDVLKPKAIEAYTGEGQAVAGDWCQYCRARPKCRALYDMGMEIIKRDFDEQLDPRLINDTELFEAYLSADFITKWLGDVKSIVLKEALAGKQWPGHKLVEGKSNRTFKDESKVIEVLEDNLYDREEFINFKLKGLGDLEKLLKKDFDPILGAYTHKPAGAPTLVDEKDKREAYGISQAKKDFADNDEFLDDDDLN